VFPLLTEGEDAGCVDVGFEWEAPAEVGGTMRRIGGFGWWAGVIVVLFFNEWW
jgi:hypothetical protein